MPRTRPAYPPEFKMEAVRLAQSGDKSIATIARGRPLGSIGVADQTLRGWVQRDGLTTTEREELRRLRREHRVLTQERDILKKAAAFFARESDVTR